MSLNPRLGFSQTPLSHGHPAAGSFPLELSSVVALFVNALMPTSRIRPCIYLAFRLPFRRLNWVFPYAVCGAG